VSNPVIIYGTTSSTPKLPHNVSIHSIVASMLVPGIGNAPINVIRSRNRKFIETNKKFPRFLSRSSALLEKQKKEQSHMCYDAFCYGKSLIIFHVRQNCSVHSFTRVVFI
jgi:hypothetical protein